MKAKKQGTGTAQTKDAGPPGSSPEGDARETERLASDQDPTRLIRKAWLAADYERAAQIIDAQDSNFQARPEVRFARARAAVELGDVARARVELKLIQDNTLQEEISGLQKRLAKTGASAEDVVREFGARTDPEAVLLRAIADCDSASETKCLTTMTNWLKRTHGKSVALELAQKARTKRLEVAEKLHARAAMIDDCRWLAVHDPQSAKGRAAPDTLAANGATLSPQERQERLIRLAEVKAFAQLDEELAAQGTGTRARSVTVLRARAFGLYEARESESAVGALDELRARDPENAPEYGYFAARSLLRMNAEEEAERRLLALSRGTGTYADHALYQLARLEWQKGERTEAISRLENYMRRFGKKGRNRARAEYDLAIFELAQKNGRSAAQKLSQLAKVETNPKEKARLLELLGVARILEGDAKDAIAHFQQTVALSPLSLAATFASARLRELGEKTPSSLEPALPSPGPTRRAELPERVRRLDEIGLSREAEDSLYRVTRLEQGALPENERKQRECSLFGQLERAERVYRLAQTYASASELRYHPEGPHRWHWECLYPRPHRETVSAIAGRTSVPEPLIYAVMRQESAFRSEVVSSAGAIGLMQLMPQTADRVAQDLGRVIPSSRLFAPEPNVELGAHYLGHLGAFFGVRGEGEPVELSRPTQEETGADLGRIGMAVLAYNAGPTIVTRWLQRFGDVPLDVFFALVPYEETRNYGYRVLSNLARYEVLEFGEQRTLLSSLDPPRPPELSVETY